MNSTVHPPSVRGPLCDYIRHLANMMGLRDWEFELKWRADKSTDDDPDEIEYASCKPTYGRKYAVLAFSHDAVNGDPYTLRNTVVHELVHCHLGGAQNIFENEVFDNVNHPQPWNTLWDGFKRQLEYAVDGMATAWAVSMPEIDWKIDSRTTTKHGPSDDPERDASPDGTTHITTGEVEPYLDRC